MSKGKKKATNGKHGGRRPGAGAKATHGAPMGDKVLVRLTPAQKEAIDAFCARTGQKAAAVMRELMLERIGRPDLGMRGRSEELKAAAQRALGATAATGT